MFSSLTSRLVLGILFIHGMLIPILYAGVIYIVKEGYQEQFIDYVRFNTYSFATNISKNLANDQPRIDQSLIDAIDTGIIEFVYINQVNGKSLKYPEDIPAESHVFKEDFYLGQHNDNSYHVATPLLDLEGEIIGNIKVGYDETGTNEYIQNAYKSAVALLLGYITLTLIFVTFSGYRLSRPLKKLQKAATNISRGFISSPFLTPSNVREIRNLAENLETMRVTLLKKGEEIQTREIRLRTVLENAAEAIIIVDENMTIESVNPAASKLFEINPENLEPTTITNLIPDFYQEFDWLNPNSKPVETNGIRSDKSSIQIELTISIMNLDDKTFLIAMCHDISDRKHTEREMLLLKNAIEASPDSVYITTPDKNILYVNPAFCLLNEMDKSTAVGNSSLLINKTNMPESYFESMWEELLEGNVWRDILLNTSDKSDVENKVWIESTIAPIKDTENKLVGVVASQRDISNQVNLTKKQELIALYANIRTKVIELLNTETNLENRIKQAMEIVTENKNNYIISDSIAFYKTSKKSSKILELEIDVCNSEVNHCYDNALDLYQINNITQNFNIIHLSKPCEISVCPLKNTSDKNHIHIFAPLKQDGILFGLLVFSLNSKNQVSQEKRQTIRHICDSITLAMVKEKLKEELENAKEGALLVAKTRSEFVANMSHEIRTPMNGVLGMLELLGNTTLSESQNRYIKTAINSAEQLVETINSILDFSKIEAGKIELEKTEFNLRTTIDEICTMLSRQAHLKSVELVAFMPVDIPDYVIGDPTRLRQVLINLTSNALKFTEKGEVVLRLTNEVTTSTTTCLQFEIEDTGIGINKNAQKTLFNPFTQADGSTTRKFGGTGLGLTISNELVTLMGGTLNIESTEGIGSCFSFRVKFPLGKMSQLINADNWSAPSDANILIVDDNKTNRLIIENYIANKNIKYTSIESPIQALQVYKEAMHNTPFTIVLLDMQMPEMDGINLAQEIKALAHEKTKLYILSSMGESIENYKEKGVEKCLNKPIRQQQLYTLLKEAFFQHVPNKNPISNSVMTNRNILNYQILLVEDNLVNQAVSEEMLLSMGASVNIAENGEIAYQMVKENRYDLILMDCQMPIMDGFEATRKIREYETVTNVPPTPIIALTANALKGDRDKCLNVGMNEYLSKPFNSQELYNTICIALSINSGPTNNTLESQHPPGINENKFNEVKIMLGARFSTILKLYIKTAEKHIFELNKAMEISDLNLLQTNAHALKSASGNLAMDVMFDYCKTLETEARLGKLRSDCDYINEIKVEFEKIKSRFEKILMNEPE